MGIETFKTINHDSIDCGGTAQVTLGITARPELGANPADIVLVLDRSKSMEGTPFDLMKKGAKSFVDTIYVASSGSNNQIAGGTKIGLVSFSTTATTDLGFTTDIDDLKNAIQGLNITDRTNHEDAFEHAKNLFDFNGSNRRIIVLFTDGERNTGGDPQSIVDFLKAAPQNVEIYIIGLEGNGGINTVELKEWASDPDSKFYKQADNEQDLLSIFAEIAKSISIPGPSGVVITETVKSYFQIVGNITVTKGTVEKMGDKSFKWTVGSVGLIAEETVSATFTIKHDGTTTGSDLPVNESVVYSDDQGHDDVTFDNPTVDITCGDCAVSYSETCDPNEIDMNNCEDSKTAPLEDYYIESLGRVLQTTLKVKNVCPGKRVAVAIILTEVDDEGNEYSRGLKTVVIPAHNESTCKDVCINCVRFVLPESLITEVDDYANPNTLCNTRNFYARVIAHSIDNDFECCEDEQV